MEPFQYREVSGIPCFFLEKWETKFPHLVVGFSGRKRGEDWNERNYALHVGDRPEQVIVNRQKLAEQFEMELAAWTCGEQVHGVHVAQVTAEDRGRGQRSRDTAFSDTDGMFTAEKNLLLASYYADCVPLYFYSPDIDVVGVAHAGWKGTVGQIGAGMIAQLHEQGADRTQIHVAIGPSIGSCCYEVDEYVMNPLRQALSTKEQVERVATPTIPGKWKLDLKLANAELLQQAGIPSEQILISQWCTSCADEHFYSHRRDRGVTGRMVAWIGKQERTR